MPFLDKATAIAHQRALLTNPSEAFVGHVSSGTHHADGPVLQVPRSAEESEAIEALLRAGAPSARRSAGWVLEVRAAHHGATSVGPGRLLQLWTYSAQSLRLFEQLVSKPQADGRTVSSVVINAGALVALTSWFLSRGVSPSRFRLDGLGTTSFRLSPFWRALVEETWGCAVVDNYSLSELPAPASECAACGFHHWLPPPMITEVVDPFSRRPIDSGLGVLVVTTLAPFVTRMPLVRYWTGDLVELGPTCRRARERGLRPRGRLSQAVATARDGVLVCPQDVTDALDGRPEVARHPHPMETLGVLPPGECGAVKFELALKHARRRPVVSIRVELRFDPLVFSAAARAVGEALATDVLDRSPALRALDAKAHALEVELVRPGTLTRAWVKF